MAFSDANVDAGTFVGSTLASFALVLLIDPELIR